MLTADDETVIDVKLFKTIGLFQLLYPSANGSCSDWYRKVLGAVLGLIFGMHSIQVIGLYFIQRDLELFMNAMVMITCGLMSLTKGYVIMSNADRLCSVLDVAGYAFTSCSRRNTSEICRCRATVSTLLRIFTLTCYGALAIWLAVPWCVEEYVSFVNLDGVVSDYRNTIYFQWYPVSESVYNSQCAWTLIYAIEVVSLSVNVFSWVMFDCYTLTVCFALKTHFNTLSAAYEALGYRRSSPMQNLSDIIPIECNDNNKLNYYDELIIHLKDNQKIIKKLDYFYDVVKPVILVQISNGLFQVIITIYLTILTYTRNRSILSVPFFKYFCGFVTTAMEFYMFCYAFDKIEVAISTVNFGLYSSNWTEMDLKFKNTILLAMNMNSAHKKVMKISPKSLINLEIFARVMNMSYTFVSVLLNTSSQE